MKIYWLKKHGYLEDGYKYGGIRWTYGDGQKSSISFYLTLNMSDKQDNIRLDYTHTDSYTGEKQKMDYEVQIISTQCRYGGKRYWFVCPLYKNGRYCGRRVGVLFGIGKWFGCRHCGDIAYAAQMRGGKFRSFVSIPDVDKAEQAIKRYYYKGQPTKKYKRYLRLNERFEEDFMYMAARLDKRFDRFIKAKKVLKCLR